MGAGAGDRDIAGSTHLSFDGSRGGAPINAPQTSPIHGPSYGIVTPTSPRGSPPKFGLSAHHFDISTPATRPVQHFDIGVPSSGSSKATSYFIMGMPASHIASPKSAQFFRDSNGKAWADEISSQPEREGKTPAVGKWAEVSKAAPGSMRTRYCFTYDESTPRYSTGTIDQPGSSRGHWNHPLARPPAAPHPDVDNGSYCRHRLRNR